jgi:thiamine biosynthesis lipoprotein ApbE
MAGGDLRCFGAPSFPVWVRCPDPIVPAPMWHLQLRGCALATSGRYFGATLWNTANDFPCESWTVTAPTATAADALTKVVCGLGADSKMLLRRCRARGWHIRKVDSSFVCVEL